MVCASISDEDAGFDFSRIFSLHEAWRRKALRVRLEGVTNGFPLFRAEMPLAGPIVCRYSSGTVPMDLMGTEWPPLILLSYHVLDLFRANAFTGWTTYPVIVHGKQGEVIEGYAGLAVTGYCGPLDESLSEKVWRPPVTDQGIPYQVWRGMYFDPGTWDGSDIFAPESTGHVFVVQKVRDALLKAKARNVSLEPLTEVEETVF